MYVRTALARSATYAAAAVLDDPAIGDPLVAGAAAKLLAGEAALENARAAIQVHGGLGFTWEMLPNYLLKRAWVLEHAFGDGDAHAFSISASIEAALA
jgi:alkylation response protein AidB-like acyl-CoA dehydrogenase